MRSGTWKWQPQSLLSERSRTEVNRSVSFERVPFFMSRTDESQKSLMSGFDEMGEALPRFVTGENFFVVERFMRNPAALWWGLFPF